MSPLLLQFLSEARELLQGIAEKLMLLEQSLKASTLVGFSDQHNTDLV